MKRRLYTLSLILVLGCGRPRQVDTLDPVAESSTRVSYDEDKVERELEAMAKMLPMQFGVEVDLARHTRSIDGPRAIRDFPHLMPSTEALDESPMARLLLDILESEASRVYVIEIGTQHPDKEGLPSRMLYIPIPVEYNADTPFFALMDHEQEAKRQEPKPSSTSAREDETKTRSPTLTQSTLLDLKDVEKLIYEDATFLIVIGGECGSYELYKSEAPLQHTPHHTAHFDDAQFYTWHNMLGVKSMVVPSFVFFKEGQLADIHYGYTGIQSLSAFLYRNALSEDGERYYRHIERDTFDDVKSWASRHKSNLSGLSFEGVDLTRAALYRCSVNGSRFDAVDFSGADMRQCDFRNASLEGSTLQDVDLTGSIWGNTICPDGSLSETHPDKACGLLNE